jgi:carbonic anhydrase/acetyltransferase-like protein (isoleucine patch superfamily)
MKNFESLGERLDEFLRKKPSLGKDVYIARGAVVVGDVTLGDGASVWYNAVLRGDINRIVVGTGSNIQDNSVLHLADDFPCIVGSYVTVGHSAIVHACTIGDECLIGMGAVILDGAEIGAQCLIGARALVTQNTKIPAGSLVLGAPAKVARALTPEERSGLKYWGEKYSANAAYCLAHNINVGAPLPS